MNKIKMLITDLDGTFMDSHYVLNQKNVEAIHAAMEKGIICCASTARNWALASYPMQSGGFNDCISLCNGAAIMDTRYMEVRYKNRMMPEQFRLVLDVLDELEHVEVTAFKLKETVTLRSRTSNMFINMHDNWNNSPQMRREKVTIVDDMDALFKKCKDDAILLTLRDSTGEDFPDELYTAADENDLSVTSAEKGNMQIMAWNVSKVVGAKILADIYGIDRENVLAIGDNENDLGMIEWAGIGVAVGNARESVKQAADYVSLRNTQGGVAHAIEKFIL